MEIHWTPAPRTLRDFNGLTATAPAPDGRREIGIFHEPNQGGGPYPWRVRYRPLGPDGTPRDGWSAVAYCFRTKREAVAHFAAEPEVSR